MKFTDEAKVGLFTLIGLGLLVVVISFLGIFSFTSNGYNLNVEFEQIKGLKPDNVVRYAGVDIGQVQDISFKEGKVNVRLQINKKYQIPQGSIFTIGSDGLLGEKFVDVIPSKTKNPDYLVADSKVKGVSAKGIDEFLESSSNVLGKMESMADSINNIIGDKQVQDSLKQTINNTARITANLDKLTLTMNDILNTNQGQINEMISQLNSMAHSLNNSAAQVEKIAVGAEAQGATGENIARLFSNIASTSERIDNMAKKLEQLVTDEKTSKTIKGTLENAHQASERANKILGNISKINAKASADFSYAGKAENSYRTDLNVKVTNGGQDFLLVGISDVGEGNDLNLQLGKSFQALNLRMGSMQGAAGVGLDYRLSNRLTLFTELYDTKEHYLRIGGEYKLANNLYLLGQSMDVKGNDKNTYIGLRQYF